MLKEVARQTVPKSSTLHIPHSLLNYSLRLSLGQRLERVLKLRQAEFGEQEVQAFLQEAPGGDWKKRLHAKGLCNIFAADVEKMLIWGLQDDEKSYERLEEVVVFLEEGREELQARKLHRLELDFKRLCEGL